MRKEFLVAIFAGTLFGVLGAFGISSDAEDSIVKTHTDRLFQQPVNLNDGISQVAVTSFDQDIPKDHFLTVVNSSVFAAEGKVQVIWEL